MSFVNFLVEVALKLISVLKYRICQLMDRYLGNSRIINEIDDVNEAEDVANIEAIISLFWIKDCSLRKICRKNLRQILK